MIYELSLMARAESSDEQITALEELVRKVVEEYKGEVLVVDDWGRISLPQPARSGDDRGRFLYFMFRGAEGLNNELARRFKINDLALKHIIVLLGKDDEAGQLVKAFKVPFSKKYNGSVTDTEDGKGEDEKERRRFARRRSCWFKARGITADWKDPKTYQWLVNEFGKISPARVSGISRKHQRIAETAIKRARNMGFISHTSNWVATKL